MTGELSWGRIIAVCTATLVACIVLRLLWVFPARYLIVRPGPDPITGRRPPWTYTFVLGWAGMRGVVTLAAAFVIPEDTRYREVLLLMAFTVVAGTLFIQGMSLPWVARRLRVPGPDPAEDALARATLLQQASKAALHRLDELEYDDSAGRRRADPAAARPAQLRGLGTARHDRRTGSRPATSTPGSGCRCSRPSVSGCWRSAAQARSPPRSSPTCWPCSTSRSRCWTSPPRSAVKHARPRPSARTGGSCGDLEHYPAVDTVSDPVCQHCLDEGLHWVSLRQCLECGDVGCCDSSVAQHATKHFHETTHPVMESAEPGEDWRWCFVHHKTA